ncbi:MAG: hypothetical protein E3J56_12820 [Candidatus Aminicenantes bacterium]|nr:MAG: hypothetical protein E3J56_12820 [Candidatus Aminicenantes bacterium]
MKLREIEDYGFKILTEKAKDGSMTVYAKFSEAEKRNQNSRIYPLKILSREVYRLQTKIAAGQFLGQTDHGDSPQTFLKDVSHIVTGLEMVGNEGFAKIKILNTDAGRNVQEIIRGKGKIGISTRSVGTVDAKTGMIQSDLKLLALDLVANPSVVDATIGKENILEGLNFEEEDKMCGLSSDYVEEMMEDVYHIYLTEENFKGDFEDFKKENGKIVLAEILVAEGKCKDTEEALKHLDKFEKSEKIVVEKPIEGAIQDRTFSFFLEAQKGGFLGDFNAWKKQFPKLVEQAGESIKIIEKKKEIKVSFKNRISWDEAVASGFHGTISEYREQYPDVELILPLPPQKLVSETLEEEATRIFKKLKKEAPNSSLQLEDVKKLLEKEQEEKVDKRIRRRAIITISKELDGEVSQAVLEKMVEAEIEALKRQRQEMRKKNWAAYQKLLD